MISLPVFDQSQRLQGLDYVISADGCQLSNFLDGQVVPVLSQQIQQYSGPVTAIADLHQMPRLGRSALHKLRCLCTNVP